MAEHLVPLLELSPERRRILQLLFCLYLVIGASSLISFVHPRLRRPEARKIRQAMNSWWLPALFGTGLVLFGSAVAVLMVLGLSLGTLREYLRLLPAADRHPVLDALAYLAGPLHYAALWFGGPNLFFGGILFWSCAILPLARAVLKGPEGWLAASSRLLFGRLLFGLLLCVLALSHLALFFRWRPALPPAGVVGLLALILLSVMVSDAGQFISGKLLGRNKLAPRLSPNKTREGLYGGALICAVVTGAAAPLVSPLSQPAGALLGILLCLGGLAGDLLVSAVKRDRGIKDSGAVLPGQGGLLDRCDSLLLILPLTYHLLLPWLS